MQKVSLKMINGGQELKDSVDQTKAQLAENATLVSQFGAVADGVTDDTTPIQNALNALAPGETLRFDQGKTYLITNTINVPSGVTIDGNKAKLKVGTNGLDKVFTSENTDGLSIRNFFFDQNLKGRTVINLKNVRNFDVSGNHFTGYTADFGTSTTESAIRITACQVGNVKQNVFEQFGQQYDTTTATLNRCITIQKDGAGVESEHILVSDNHFIDVNQSIVINSGIQQVISNNIFDGQSDNSIYAFGDGIIIEGNSFRNRTDETLVISGKNYLIANNTFYDVKNKLLAFNGDTERIVFSNNIFDNAVVSAPGIANIIATRDAYTITDLLIEGNEFKIGANTSSFPYFDFLGQTINIKAVNNTMDLANSNGQKIFNFAGTVVSGDIKNNTVRCTTAFAMFLDTGATTDASGLTAEANTLTNARYWAAKNGIVTRDQRIQVNAGPYATNKPSTRNLYATAIPTIGTWKRGDVLWNETPAAGSPLGWVCVADGTPGTWASMGGLREDYVTPTLLNGWVADEVTPQYRRNVDNTVELRGQVKSGTPSATSHVFTLPSGFRPSTKIMVAVSNSKPGTGSTSSIAMARVVIQPNGNVTVETGDGSFVSLDGIRFSTV